jgi:uncharacterized protein YbjQ (UPF0145 family)
MILSSTNTLENKKIVAYKGIVTGESLIGSNVYKDLFSGVRDVVGGRTSKYEEEIEELNTKIVTLEQSIKKPKV